MKLEIPKTILLVEDEPITAMVETAALEKYGYKVIPADTGENALEIVGNTPGIDLILMDIDLGVGMNGPETARLILKNHDIPLVFLSSHTEPEVVELTEKISSYGYVVKNSTITVLDASIKMAFKLFYARNSLAQNEKKQATMIGNISDVIGIIGLDGYIKFTSPNISKWFGWKSEELVGTSGWLIVHPDDMERVQNDFLALITQDGATTTIEYRYKCKDGSFKLIELCAINLSNDPAICGLLLNYHDISQRKSTEEALRKSESSYRLLAENVSDMLTRHTPEGAYTYLSHSCHALLGYEPQELIGVNPYQLFHPDDVLAIQNTHGQVVENVDVNLITYRIRRKDGQYVWLETSNKTITDPNSGQVVEIICISRDITDRKRTEDALRKNLAESQEFHRLTVGRELAMIDLKAEVNDLRKQLGMESKYQVPE